MTIPLVITDAAACTRCDLRAGAGQVVCGLGPHKASLAIVGEWPGPEEDLLGRPFEGRDGRLLRRLLAAAEIDATVVWKTYAVKCAPPGRETPKAAHVKSCRTWLQGELSAVRPKVVITLGKLPARVLLGLKANFVLKDYVGRHHQSHEFPGVAVWPWVSLAKFAQQGKAADEATVKFFRTVKEKALRA